MKFKLKLMAIVGSVILAATVFTGAVFAQEPVQPPPQPPIGQQGQPPVRPPRNRGALLEPIAEALGMSVDDLKAELKAGQRLEDIAAEQGVSMADIANAVYDYAADRVASAVADGKLTQDQADKILGRLQERRDACVEEDQCHLFAPKNPRPQLGTKQIIEMGKVIADTLNMEPRELLQALRAGQTLEEIAAEQGVSMQDIADAVYNDALERLNNAVADGKLTQDQADKIQARLDAQRDKCVNDGKCLPPRRRIQQNQFNRPHQFNPGFNRPGGSNFPNRFNQRGQFNQPFGGNPSAQPPQQSW